MVLPAKFVDWLADATIILHGIFVCSQLCWPQELCQNCYCLAQETTKLRSASPMFDQFENERLPCEQVCRELKLGTTNEAQLLTALESLATVKRHLMRPLERTRSWLERLHQPAVVPLLEKLEEIISLIRIRSTFVVIKFPTIVQTSRIAIKIYEADPDAIILSANLYLVDASRTAFFADADVVSQTFVDTHLSPVSNNFRFHRCRFDFVQNGNSIRVIRLKLTFTGMSHNERTTRISRTGKDNNNNRYPTVSQLQYRCLVLLKREEPNNNQPPRHSLGLVKELSVLSVCTSTNQRNEGEASVIFNMWARFFTGNWNLADDELVQIGLNHVHFYLLLVIRTLMERSGGGLIDLVSMNLRADRLMEALFPNNEELLTREMFLLHRNFNEVAVLYHQLWNI